MTAITNAQISPLMIETKISRRTSQISVRSLIWPIAIARISTVRLCVPAIPPMEATIGINTAKATTFSISSWKNPITIDAKIAVSKLSSNQLNLLLVFFKTPSVISSKLCKTPKQNKNKASPKPTSSRKTKIYLSLSEKLDIIKKHDLGANYSQIARDKNMGASSVRAICDRKAKIKAQNDLKEAQNQIEVIKEEAKTTSVNYENQLSLMSEHLANMNDKLTKQTDEIERLKFEVGNKKKGSK